MSSQHKAPLAAFLVVSIACIVVVVNALRSDALSGPFVTPLQAIVAGARLIPQPQDILSAEAAVVTRASTGLEVAPKAARTVVGATATSTPHAAAPVHTAPVHTASVHTAPVHTASVHTAPVHSGAHARGHHSATGTVRSHVSATQAALPASAVPPTAVPTTAVPPAPPSTVYGQQGHHGDTMPQRYGHRGWGATGHQQPGLPSQSTDASGASQQHPSIPGHGDWSNGGDARGQGYGNDGRGADHGYGRGQGLLYGRGNHGNRATLGLTSDRNAWSVGPTGPRAGSGGVGRSGGYGQRGSDRDPGNGFGAGSFGTGVASAGLGNRGHHGWR